MPDAGKATHLQKPRPLHHAKTVCCGNSSASAAGGDSKGRDSLALDDSYRDLMKRKSEHSMATKPVPELPTEELDQLEVLFRETDKNGDGVVDFDEFKTIMALLGGQTGRKYNILQLKGLFRLADFDGSGSIDFNEFLHAQRRLTKTVGLQRSATMLASAMAEVQKGMGL